MGSLSDEFKKAGLLSANKAKKIQREDSRREHQRRKAVKTGDEEAAAALETEQERLRKERESVEAQERERLSRENERQRKERAAWDEVERSHAIIDGNRVHPGKPEQQWRFVASSGKLEVLKLSDENFARLTGAELAVVERPPVGTGKGFTYILLPAEAALRLEKLEPMAIRFLNLPSRSAPVVVGGSAGSKDPESSATDESGGAAEEDDFMAGLD